MRPRLDVDYEQWRALLRVALKLDVREATLGGRTLGVQGSGVRALAGALILYVVTGAVLAPLIWLSADVLFTGTIFLTYAMLLVGGLVLLDFQAVVTSPKDREVLGFQPVGAPTYLAAKFANLLFYVVVVTTAIGIGPFTAFFLKDGFHAALGVAAVVATYLSTSATALAMLLSYACIVAAVRPERLRRALSYLQLGLSTLVFGGYVLLPALMDDPQMVRLALPKVWWIWLHPATWFASYLELARGRLDQSYLLAAVGSLLTLVLLAAGVRRVFTLADANTLVELARGPGTPVVQGTGTAGVTHPLRWFRRNEPRAAALLIRAQFRYDQRFRLSVLAVIPMLLMFLLVSIPGASGRSSADGWGVPDPFTDPEVGLRPNMLYFALVLAPVMVMMEVARSDQYRAAWIFSATPHDVGRLVVSIKNVVMVYFVIPLLLVLAGFFTYAFGHLGHTLIHTAILGLICHLYLQLAVLVAPNLPFSRPPQKIDRMSIFLINILAVLPAMFLLQPALAWAYAGPARLVTTVATIAGVSALLDRLCAWRVRRRWARAEFAG
jgi:hypothetical protein